MELVIASATEHELWKRPGWISEPLWAQWWQSEKSLTRRKSP